MRVLDLVSVGILMSLLAINSCKSNSSNLGEDQSELQSAASKGSLIEFSRKGGEWRQRDSKKCTIKANGEMKSVAFDDYTRSGEFKSDDALDLTNLVKDLKIDKEAKDIIGNQGLNIYVNKDRQMKLILSVHLEKGMKGSTKTYINGQTSSEAGDKIMRLVLDNCDKF